MQYLLLGRHGNTFAPEDKVVWVGARNDLPLVESGVKQANDLAQAMLDADLKPEIIYSGPLKRASSYAQIVHDSLNLSTPVQIDSRLQEIDYGKWSGLTDQEIKAQFGKDEFDQWQNQNAWPISFADSEKEISTQVFSFVKDHIISQPKRKFTLIITSNGRLRYFLKLVPEIENKLSNNTWKVSTGQLSLLTFADSTWKVIAWNESPHSMCRILENHGASACTTTNQDKF